MIEIERKFLVKSFDFKKQASKQTKIIQGFLNTHKARTVRIRIKDNKGYITIKGKSSKDGLSRFEWEKEIKKTEAKALLKLCKPTIIHKVRYEVKVNNHTFEIDQFLDKNEGLILAEIELNSTTEFFEKPNWLGSEVTGIIKYYNSQLSKHPYKNWGL